MALRWSTSSHTRLTHIECETYVYMEHLSTTKRGIGSWDGVNDRYLATPLLARAVYIGGSQQTDEGLLTGAGPGQVTHRTSAQSNPALSGRCVLNLHAEFPLGGRCIAVALALAVTVPVCSGAESNRSGAGSRTMR